MGGAVALAAALALSGCSSDGGDGDGDAPRPDGSGTSRSATGGSGSATAAPAKGSVKVVRTLATGLKSPWGLARLSGGDLLVASRDSGTVQRVDAGSGATTPLGTVPGVAAGGEGGLLGLAVPPDSDRMVYAYLTTESDNRIVRMLYDPKKPEGEQLGAPDVLLKGIPKGAIHNGGRIAFGPDKMLYAGTGESGTRGLSQDKDSLGGKILRMTPDGEPPGQGNPERDSVVYSYGHRNVQGLDWDRDKRLWASEFGQDTWDELNLIEPGKNYGWPEAEGKGGGGGFTDPVEQWRPADASPSGLAVARGSVWMAGLRGERLWRVPLRGAEPAAEPQAFLEGKYGRLRTVVSDGTGSGLWLVTSETDSRGTPGKRDDRILRLKVE
ncbi:PQQ-dependent sugar dehydrogenase [Streptomyces sp. SB3404]|uniref:PQQ-dependent sugar dehydrogenase n=1 Tax=Streptomyces boncukensis TaxID=2711219 RepID=A0A6G4WV05_9ACTN|nr:PQQ-dependent sugar dehydrogenase [Streptomyces boncukensis]